MSKTNLKHRWTPSNWLAIGIPLVVYALFIFFAFLIGSKYSCEPIANFYWWGGLASLPVLFSVPFIFARNLHIALRVVSAIVSTGLGIVVWGWAHDAARMGWVCGIM